jgi:hypothetical protein
MGRVLLPHPAYAGRSSSRRGLNEDQAACSGRRCAPPLMPGVDMTSVVKGQWRGAVYMSVVSRERTRGVGYHLA